MSDKNKDDDTNKDNINPENIYKIEKEDAMDDNNIIGDNIMDIYEGAINKLWTKMEEIKNNNSDLTTEKINEIFNIVQVARYTFAAAKEVVEFSDDNLFDFELEIPEDDDEEDEDNEDEDFLNDNEE